jgi:hypothetical protein
MKKFILISLVLIEGLNALAQSPKLKIVLYPNTDIEYDQAVRLMNDTTFNKEFCFDIIRKQKDPSFPAQYGIVKVDFFSCEGDIMVASCQSNTMPNKKELTLYANMSLTIASDPKLRKTTKVLY